MAHTEQLPNYRTTYALCLYPERAARCISPYQRCTLGAELRDGPRLMPKLLVRANARREKAPALPEVREEVEQLKVVVRLCQDVKAFANFGAFAREGAGGGDREAERRLAEEPPSGPWPEPAIGALSFFCKTG